MKPASCVALLTATAALLSLSTAAFADSVPFDWDLSTVDPAPTSGNSLGLVVDASGTGHVAFWTIAVGVRYGTGSADSWTIETLPDVGTPPPGAMEMHHAGPPPDETHLIQHTGVSLGIAPDGTPWIAQIDHGRITHSDAGPLAIRHREGGTWVTEWLGVVGAALIDIAPNGDVHVAWTEGSNIIHARRIGPNSWAPEVAFAGGSLGALQAASDGTVHLVTGESFSGVSHHVERAPDGGWTPTPVATPVFGVYQSASLALDPQGRPTIVLNERDPLYPRNHLRLHRRIGTTWTAENVDVDETPKLGGSLAFDSAGNPLVVYRRDVPVIAVVAAVPGPGGWTWSVVDTVGTGNQGVDGEFGPAGRPWFVNATQGLGVRLAVGRRTVGVPDAATVVGALRLGAPRPSPGRAGATIGLAIDALEAGTITLEEVDARGRVRHREVRRVEAGSNVVPLPTRGLAPGIYWVRVVDDMGRADARRFVIAD
jgi:hypothetical protein